MGARLRGVWRGVSSWGAVCRGLGMRSAGLGVRGRVRGAEVITQPEWLALAAPRLQQLLPQHHHLPQHALQNSLRKEQFGMLNC